MTIDFSSKEAKRKGGGIGKTNKTKTFQSRIYPLGKNVKENLLY